jgi:hypothetical protein
VRFGGAAVDDGGWMPAARESARFEDGTIVLDMPGASAALVTSRWLERGTPTSSSSRDDWLRSGQMQIRLPFISGPGED